MVATVHFSDFPMGGMQLPTDIVVGLRAGVNTQFVAGGSGGGGVTQVITQTGNNLLTGQWVRLNSSGLYVTALADNPQDGEVVGVVVGIIVLHSQFVLQQAGYVSPALGIFSALTTGAVYFLDVTTSGNMVLTDALINGQVSRPVFVADSPTSGWVLPYRGLIVGGAAPPSPSGNGNLVAITQAANGLSAGNVVRLNGSIDYVTAQGDSLADAQAVGVVVSIVNANQFVLQTNGYYTNSPATNVGPFNLDDMGNPLVAGHVYYVSSTVAGGITGVNPTTGTNSSKPIYIAEQVWGTTGTNAGYILEQRPLLSVGSTIFPNAFAMALLFGR